MSAKSGSNVNLGFHEISKDLTSQFSTKKEKKDLKKTVELLLKK